jgi:fumarate reductase flavoprotein subunit
LVFGARAGRAATAFASEQKEPGVAVHAQAEDEQERIEQRFFRKAGGRERISTLRSEMQKTMEECAGIYRHGPALEQAAGQMRRLQERVRDLALDDRSLTFNTELVAALELSCMLDVAETMIHSALARRESRGAHQRTDHPARDDAKYLAHSLAYCGQDGAPRIEYQPVTITRWPPGKRVYGK